MKKVITIVITLLLLLSLATPAFADDVTIDDFLEILDQAFEESLGRDCFEILTYGRLIVLNTWAQGGGKDFAGAKAGSLGAKTAWSGMLANVTHAQKTLQDSLDKLPGSYIVIYNFLDETDHTLLLSVSEGEVLYDATKLETVLITSPSAEPPSKASADLTIGQRNAIGSAQSYLSFSAFSRDGLIRQLEFEGYSSEDAAFAVDSLNVDWNEQAAKSAENYLSFSTFSRDGLIKQLEFEGYTHEQAVYGVEQAGY